jgi:hypothetical protein
LGIEYSRSSRAELIRLGAEGLVRAAEKRFNAAHVYYSRVSATGESPANGKWRNPRPVGCALPVVQILLDKDTV